MSAFVLVHGAWHDGQAWNRVVPRLGAAGWRSYAPSLTGHGERRHLASSEVDLGTHVDDIVRLLVEEDLTEVVLVGHSYAGMVIAGVAERVPERIARLVFVDAMVPDDGESALDIIPMTQALIDSAADTGHPWRIPPLPSTQNGWFGVTDPRDLRWLETFVGDEPVGCFTTPVRIGNPAAAWIPRAHIHCVDGRAPGRQRRPVPAVQPNGRPSVVRELATGHDCMITAPNELADLLLELAGEPA